MGWPQAKAWEGDRVAGNRFSKSGGEVFEGVF